jgi:hypothetical protein
MTTIPPLFPKFLKPKTYRTKACPLPLTEKRTFLILLKNHSGQKATTKNTTKSLQPLDKNLL